jgi:peptidyl-prolyl cis-trans isomerase C
MSTFRILLAMIIAVCYLSSCGSSKEPGTKAQTEEHDHEGHDHAGHDHDHAGHDHAVQTAATPAAKAAPHNPHAHADHFIVSVNGKKLGHEELNAMVQQVMGSQLSQIPPQMRQQFMQQMGPQAQAQAIDRFIGGEVLEAEADKQKVTAGEDAVKERLDMLRGQIPESVAWEDALKEMGTGETEVRAEISRDLKIRAVIDKQLDALPKTPTAELKAVYDKDPSKYATENTASARHILLTTKGDDDAAKAEKLASIKKLRQEIVDGADFAELAKGHSDCPSKERGGDLGSFGKGRMAPAFEKAAFDQELSKVGEVVETSFGYHIIEVSAREEARQQTFEEVEEQIEAELNRERDGNAVAAYVKSLRDGAKIVYGHGHEPPPTPAAP